MRVVGRRSADFQSAPECRLDACATSNLRNREREVPLRILLRGGPAVFGRNEDGGLAGGARVGSLRAMDVYARARESIDAAHSAAVFMQMPVMPSTGMTAIMKCP
jgi:hypothetical protein